MSDTAEEQAIAPLECSLTIEQFAKAEGFSPGTYYKLRALGMGPDELRVAGTKIVRVTQKARAEWHARLQAYAKSEAGRLEEARRSELSRAAGKLAAQSPVHISKRRRRRTAQREEAV